LLAQKGKLSKTKSRASDEARIDGIEQFNEHAELFNNLTLTE